MAEYIEREALLIKLKKLFTQEVLEDATTQEIARGAIMFVENEPTADVTDVKHGKWDNNGEFHQCSKCSNFTSYEYDYCPYCGAKMDGDK